jgi:hypothetical protein
MRKPRFRKFSVGIYHTIKKKEREIDICTRLSHFAKRTVGFRRYRIVRLGAPAKLKKLHSKIGRRVDSARVRYGTMQSESMRSHYGAPSLSAPLFRLLPAWWSDVKSVYKYLNRLYM